MIKKPIGLRITELSILGKATNNFISFSVDVIQ